MDQKEIQKLAEAIAIVQNGVSNRLDTEIVGKKTVVYKVGTVLRIDIKGAFE